MGWIITGLANLMLEIVNNFLKLFSGVYSTFELDVGENGLFDNLFSSAGTFMNIFMYTGLLIVAALFAFKLFQTLLGPLSEGESPIALIGRAIMAGIGVAFSYQIFLIIQKGMNFFYTQYITLYTGAGEGVDSYDEVMNGFSLVGNATHLVKNQSEYEWDEDLIIAIIMVFMFGALCIELIKFTAEFFMRYVVLGALFYTSPLAFATLATDSTRKIFSSWCTMVGSQFVLMFLNLFVIGIFQGAMVNVFDGAIDRGYLFNNLSQFFSTVFILIGILILGQRLDQYLSSLGMSVAQTGANLGTAIVGGGMVLRTIIGYMAGASLLGGKLLGKVGKTGKFARNKYNETKTGKQGSIGENPGIGGYNSGWDIVAGAERQNGTLTKRGASDILNSSGAKVSGQDAKDAMRAVGIFTSGLKNETGADMLNGADWEKSSFGDGLATIRDSNGSVIYQAGLAEHYQPPQNQAYKSFETDAGTMNYAATHGIVAADNNNIIKDLSENKNYSGISWKANKNGTISGYSTVPQRDSSGNIIKNKNGDTQYHTVQTHQASSKYMATANYNNGPVVDGKVKDVPYFVQDIRKGRAGFKEIKSIPNSPVLTNKSVKGGQYTNSPRSRAEKSSYKEFVRNEKRTTLKWGKDMLNNAKNKDANKK